MRKNSLFRDVSVGAGVTIATAVCCFALFVLLQALSYWTPRDRIEGHLREAFERNDLQLAYSLPYDSTRGHHQRNDCLIFWMSIVRPDDIARYLAAGQYVADPAGRATYCETLRDHLMGDPIVKYDEGNYLRYLHGYRAVTAFALSVFDVPEMRILFKGLCYGLLASVALAGLWRLLRQREQPREMGRIRAWAGIGAAVSFALFYGLQYFGQSPSHAPAAWVIFLFLLFSSQVDLLKLRRLWFFAAMSAFGAFTAFFEYLTGAAVIGLALLFAMMAMQGGADTPTGLLVRRSALGACSYLGGLVMAFALNLVLNVAYFGRQNLVRFFDALATRMGATAEQGFNEATVHVTPLDVLQALVSKLDYLTAGNPALAQILFVCFGFAIAGFGLVGFINSRSVQSVVRVLLVFASVAVIVLWFLAFKNHTLIHAAFMVRILVWIPTAAVLMAVLVFGYLWSAAPERREVGAPLVTGTGA